MKKNIFIIWDDFYHPSEIIKVMLAKIFDSQSNNIIYTKRARDLINTNDKQDLIIFFASGILEGEHSLSFEEQEKIISLVNNGAGIMFYHAGLVHINEDGPLYKKLNSGRFIHHPEECDVKISPIPNCPHKITNGVADFCQNDEHYFCKVDISSTNLLACSTSEHITAASVWCHEYGNGRVVGISQGHTLEMQNDPEMIKLIKNSVNWLVNREV